LLHTLIFSLSFLQIEIDLIKHKRHTVAFYLPA